MGLSLVSEGVTIIEQQIDFSNGFVDAFAFNDVLEGPFAIRNKLRDEVFILLEAAK